MHSVAPRPGRCLNKAIARSLFACLGVDEVCSVSIALSRWTVHRSLSRCSSVSFSAVIDAGV